MLFCHLLLLFHHSSAAKLRLVGQPRRCQIRDFWLCHTTIRVHFFKAVTCMLSSHLPFFQGDFVVLFCNMLSGNLFHHPLLHSLDFPLAGAGLEFYFLMFISAWLKLLLILLMMVILNSLSRCKARKSWNSSSEEQSESLSLFFFTS